MSLLHSVELTAKVAEGPYDLLYRQCRFLWPNRPGRMVRLAADIKVPIRCLDVGCGDGKHIVFLEALGCPVDGIDISGAAISLAEHRRSTLPAPPLGILMQADACKYNFGILQYDLVICYGIYHCLSDESLLLIHRRMERALMPGGYFAFAAFNADLPLPKDHPTPGVILRHRDHILELVQSWERIAYQCGEIEEKHEPLIGIHKHSLTWALFRKPTL